MQRVSYEELLNQFKRVLLSRGFVEPAATEAATVFAQNSLDGIYSHGINRFPRVVGDLDHGTIDPSKECTVEMQFGAMERWNGNYGFGPLNAKRAMQRACELAKQHGVGVVALGKNNHWMRGGSYGWQAANEGMIGICWSNTLPNMPAWGGKDEKLGNNPLVISIPRANGAHVVLDCAMSQFSYGKLEEYRLNKQQLPLVGGYNKNNELTTDPAEVEETRRVLPMGYWKGSGLSLVLDMVGAVLSNGHSTMEVGKRESESGLTQMFIALDPTKFNTEALTDETVSAIIDDLHLSIPVVPGTKVRYPGEREFNTRKDNTENGIPVNDEKWNTLISF